MKVLLEHANLTVRDVDGMLRFLTTAFPAFRVRREWKYPDGERALHVGTDEVYLCLTEAREGDAEVREPYAGSPGLNHLGFEVDDAEAVRRRLLAAGYEDTTYPNAHPHRRRVYFHDAEGNDWEFVEYLSEDPALRNDYELGDVRRAD